jgi:formylglycine-generating enzyme
MGSPPSEPGRYSNEDQVDVTLTHSFWLMATEVTQGQYLEVMGKNPSRDKGDDLPVEQVRWLDAVKYANALSTQEGLASCYRVTGESTKWPRGLSCRGYRLPTEAEWEYAARADESTRHSGSDTVGSVGWWDGNSGSATHRVGQKSANAWGLYDMNGNVWEWCWDWYGTELSGGRNPVGPAAGSYRVPRGGSWGSPAEDARVAVRGRVAPSQRNGNVGFRLARTAP